MAWGKAGSTTLTSTGDNLDITSMTASKTNQFLFHTLASGNADTRYKYNSTDQMALRYNQNGGSDATSTSDTPPQQIWVGYGDHFNVNYMANVSGEEKLVITFDVTATATGNTAPARMESVHKSVQSDQITEINISNGGSGDYLTDSNLTALGSDLTPAVAIPALDNVQDNSLFVDKVNARRFWFSDESTSDVTWNDSTDVGCSISGNTITKTASNGWTSGIGQTDQQVSASNGGTITMTSNATNSFIGLSNVTSLNQQAKTWFDIKFGFADEEIIENGAQITPDSAFSRATSDTMKITISSAGLVKYFVNDSLKHTSTITASGSYFGIFAAYTQNENMTATITTPSSWTMQPTLEDDFSSSVGWTQVTNTASGVSGGELIGLTNSSGTNGAGVWKDYGLVSDTKFVLRCKFQIITQSGGSGNASTLYFGISDTNGATSPQSNRDGFGIAITNYSASGMLWLYPNGTTWDSADTDLSLTPTATTYYLEIARTSATSVTFKLFSDEYSTVVKTHTQTIASTLNGLRYIMFQEWRNSSGNTTKVAVDDLQIFNGVGTVN